jgi:HK97 family phage major capsid protein
MPETEPKMTAKEVADLIKKEVLPVLRTEVEPLVAEIVEEKVAKAAEIKPTTGFGGAVDAIPGTPAERDGMTTSQKQRKAARFFLCLAAAQGDVAKAIETAKKIGDKDVIKALGESTLAAGGFLVPAAMGEFIDSLGASAIVEGVLGARKIPMPGGSITLPRGDSGATLNWVGENQNAGTSQPAGGQVNMTAKQAMVVIPLSNRLLSDAVAAQDWAEREARRAYERGTDLAYISGAGSENSPRGMLNRALAANKFNITHAGAAATLAEIYADLGKAILKLANLNIPLVNPGWAMSKRSEWHLRTLLNANGIPVFEAQMDQGRLFGFKYGSSTQIPNNYNTDESKVYLADFESVVIGDTGELEVEVVKGAAYYDSGASAVVSGLSRDQTVIVLKKRVDFSSLYDGKDIAVIQSVDWGA